ncbi:MAG: apolipoprotein N-acyltransferase, partial [Acidimicrobiia bacterium]|nr:apolipoprotein N-acyltransferase [Acidimicrobiia bacterium]
MDPLIRRVAPVLLSALAGGALSLAFPPRGWWWISLPAIALFLLQTRRCEGVFSAVMTGLAFGLSFFGFLMPWLSELGLIAFIPPVIVLSVFPALYAVLMVRSVSLPPSRWWVRAVGGWALMEWVRVRWPLG